MSNVLTSGLTSFITGLGSGLTQAVVGLFSNEGKHIKATEQWTRETRIVVGDILTQALNHWPNIEYTKDAVWQLHTDLNDTVGGLLTAANAYLKSIDDSLDDLAEYQYGGPVRRTGIARVHKGEFIVPAGARASAGGGPSGQGVDQPGL